MASQPPGKGGSSSYRPNENTTNARGQRDNSNPTSNPESQQLQASEPNPRPTPPTWAHIARPMYNGPPVGPASQQSSRPQASASAPFTGSESAFAPSVPSQPGSTSITSEQHQGGHGSPAPPSARGRGESRGRFNTRGNYRGDSGSSNRGSSEGGPFHGGRGRGGRGHDEGFQPRGRGRGFVNTASNGGRGGGSLPPPNDRRDRGNWYGSNRAESSHSRGGRGGRGGKDFKPKEKVPREEYKIEGEAYSTDTDKALAEVQTYASELVKKSDGKLTLQQVINKYGLRTSFIQPDTTTSIATNYLRMQAPNYIYVYKIEMIREYDTSNSPVFVKRFADKMRVMEVVAQDPAAVALQQVPKRWVTDGDMIWSSSPIWITNSTTVPVLFLQHVNYSNECGVQLSVEDVIIRYHITIDSRISPRELYQDAYTTNFKDSRAAILMRGLNAFFTAHARAQAGYTFSGGNRAYGNATADLLVDDGVRALKGFFLSSRPAIDSILLNINTVTSPFYPYVTVDDLLKSSRHSPDTLARVLRGVKVEILYDIIGGWMQNTPPGRTRFIYHVGDEVQTQECDHNVTVFEWFTNPAAHHRNRHLFPTNISQFTIAADTIAIETATDSRQQPAHTEWYPATMLRIVEFQSFHGDLHSDETSKMIERARLNPDENAQRILVDGMDMFGFRMANQGRLGHFNISTSTKFITIPGQWLTPPTVLYIQPRWTEQQRGRHQGEDISQHKSGEVQAASWDLRGVHFIMPAVVTHLPVLHASHKRDHELNRFYSDLKTALQNHNLLQNTQVNWSIRVCHNLRNWRPTANIGNYEREVENDLSARPDLMNHATLVLINRKDYEKYACIKRVAELKLGVHTIFCTTDNVVKFKLQNASNIALKYNLKGTGINHILGHNDLAPIKPTAGASFNTIVIGADVTHPASGGSPGTPSIAAVVGNTDDDFMHFPGSMRLQRARKEYIIELGDMVKERLIDWAEKHNDRLPARMHFYRDGVSESQYRKLRDYEIPQIQKAYNWAREYLNWKGTTQDLPRPLPPALAPPLPGEAPTPPHPNKAWAMDPQREPWPEPVQRPQNQGGDGDEEQDDEFADNTGLNEQFDLTYVVVGKRHNTRFYPMRDEDKVRRPNPAKEMELEVKNGNVKPGLVVDQVITHPHSFDFYLQSHDPIHGTGRSAHYYVLQNGMSLDTIDLQKVTHDFCYTYSRATKGVSYCTPAYYADRLCDRGRAYLRHWLKNRNGYRSPLTRTNGQPPQKQYNDRVKNWLRDDRYWRPYHNAPYPTNPGGNPPMKYGFTRRNPWHEKLDDVIFYL